VNSTSCTTSAVTPTAGSFLTTHLPAYLEICGQDPMLSAEALAVIGAVNCVDSVSGGWYLLGPLLVRRKATGMG
jgi:hypothetical protein